jgi:hypothetical protein
MPRTTDLALRKQSERLHGDTLEHAYRGSAIDSALRRAPRNRLSRGRAGTTKINSRKELVWLATAIPKVATELCGLALRVIVLGSGVC